VVTYSTICTFIYTDSFRNNIGWHRYCIFTGFLLFS